MRRYIGTCAVILLAFAVLSAGASPEGRTSISMLKGPSGLSGAWMMYELSRTSPADFSFLPMASADMVVAKLLSGEIDAGVLPVNVAAKLYNAGVPIQVLAVVGEGMIKFLTSDSTIQSIETLKGKTIYIAGQKATPDYVFQFLCAQKGLISGKDYTAVYNLSYPEIAAGLASGRIASAVLPEPFSAQALLKNSSLLSPFDITEEWRKSTGQDNFPMSLLVARKELIQTSPAKIGILMDSYRASIQKALNDPVGTGKLAEKLDLGISAQAATLSIPLSNFVFRDAQNARLSIEELLKVFLRFDPVSIGGVMPNQAFYYATRNQ